MAGREELVGSDVVVVHRLLKNRVGEDLGVPAYALYTDALVGAMGLADPAAAGMRAYRETFESVGEVAGWVTDLGAAWEAEQRRARTKVTDDDALAVITIPAAVPREILWEWTTSPARRIRWTSGMTEVVEDLANGRRGVGTVNHCAHGKNVSIEEVLDWVPPEYVTKRINMPASGAFPGSSSRRSSSRAARTRPTSSIGWPGRARSRTGSSWRRWRDQFRTAVTRDSATLIELAAADAAERAAAREAEPDVPASTARHLSAPVAAAGGPIAYLPVES